MLDPLRSVVIGTTVSTLLVPRQMHGFFTLLTLPGAAVGMDFVVEEIAKHLAPLS